MFIILQEFILVKPFPFVEYYTTNKIVMKVKKQFLMKN